MKNKIKLDWAGLSLISFAIGVLLFILFMPRPPAPDVFDHPPHAGHEEPFSPLVFPPPGYDEEPDE